jgi:hypothetical protein
MIIVLAGRRIDRENAAENAAENAQEARFPLRNVERVRERVRTMLVEQHATAVVAAAACGADLIALSEAGTLGLRRRVVLPFERRRFRETSVVDRPGNWGDLYDRILDEVSSTGDLVVKSHSEDDRGYLAANSSIIDEGLSLGKELDQGVIAALVWNGKSRGPDDISGQFGNLARERGLPVVEIKTT